jgi:hypothetical protein
MVESATIGCDINWHYFRGLTLQPAVEPATGGAFVNGAQVASFSAVDVATDG